MVSSKTVTEVKILDIDDSLETGGGRILSVKVRGGKGFRTPSRPISSKDIGAKSESANYRGVLPGDLAILPVYIQGKTFEDYCRTNGTMNEIYERIELLSDNTSFLVNVPTLQMGTLDPRDSACMLTMYRQAQIPTLSAICMPVIAGDYEVFSKNLRGWINYAEMFGKKCVP